MADPIRMMITTRGLDALVDAQSGATDAVQIAQVGLTEAHFVMAPTITSLPAEFKRIGSVSGQSVSDTVIHMTAQDNSEDIYDLRGIGLFLPDGTLFAVYSQPTPIFRKVSIAFFLLALDIAFTNGAAGDIVFGDTSFLLPPASETVKGVARLATPALAQAGADHETIITPLTLKQRLDALHAALSAVITALEQAVDADINALADGFDAIIAAIEARTITGSGLLTGGGNLSASRILEVLAASGADAIAGTATDRAVTPAALRAVQAALQVGGTGLVTGGGDLTESRTVDVKAASGADAIAGTTTDRAITPAALRALQAALQVGGTGLVTGGGDLTESRTVDVKAASGADVIAGVANDSAITPAALRVLLAALQVGGTGLVTGGGDLTESRTVDVKAASDADAIAGTATDRAITPASLRAAQAALAIGGTGLATGGGDLTQSRTVDVLAASAGDVAAGTATDRAVTPAALSGLARSIAQNGYATLPGTGGMILQWGRFTAFANATSSAIFPIAFPNACFAVTSAGGSSGGADSQDNPPVLIVSTISDTGFSVYSADDSSAAHCFIAIGN